MRAFEVHVNKKRLCLAGIGDEGHLAATLNHLIGKGRDLVNLTVGGFGSTEHVIWKQIQLSTGDEIRVKIVESKRFDKPRTRYRRYPAQEKRDLKRYVRAMAKQFGWKIIASPKKASLQ